MKRLSAAALFALGLAIPASAQHGASHGGSFSSRSAPAMHSGGFTASAPRLTGAPRYTGSMAPRSVAATPYNAAGRPAYGNNNNNRNHWNYTWRYRNGVPYLSAVWIGPGLLGSPLYDDSYGANDDTAGYAQQPAPDQQYPDQSAGQYPEQQFPIPYAQQYPAPPPYQQFQPAPTASPDIPVADAVTLVFRDGRPTEQIHNYIMTRTTLYVSDQHRREIPLDQLDLAATQKINRAAGIDFSIPGITP